MAKKDSKKNKGSKKVAVACAFCTEGVAYTKNDPISMGVVERWRPYEERPDWTVYAHRECLMSRIDPEIRSDLDEGNQLL